MAANYWDSTQAKLWTFTKDELEDVRQEMGRVNHALHAKYPLPDFRYLSLYFQQQLVKLGRRMSLRQQALATAQVYIKRFYLRVEVRKTNPYLIMTTAVYLACKMEECPQHIRLMLGEAARQWPELGVSESSKIGECEFLMISTLSSNLICHHPYRSLEQLATTFNLTSDESQTAHQIVNDSYITDVLFLYPPHIIAMTAIMLALVLRSSGQYPGLHAPSSSTYHSSSHTSSSSSSSSSPSSSTSIFPPTVSASAAQQALLSGFGGLRQAGPRLSRIVEWLAESDIDMSALIDCTQEMISMYVAWEEDYSDRACKEALSKFIKDAGLGSLGMVK